jgi:hypothetical protein
LISDVVDYGGWPCGSNADMLPDLAMTPQMHHLEIKYEEDAQNELWNDSQTNRNDASCSCNAPSSPPPHYSPTVN